MAACSSLARADVPIDATAMAELRVWSQMYWHQVATGTSAPGAAEFRFTDPRLNTPFTMPVRGSIRALQALSGQESLDLGAGPQDEVQTGGVSWDALHDYMVCGKIATDFQTDPAGTWKHWEDITTQGAIWNLNGSVLESIGLKPEPRSIPKDIAQPDVEDAETRYAIEQLRPAALLIAAGQDRSPARVTDALTGATTFYEEFAMQLHEVVLSLQVSVPTQESYVQVAWGKNMLATVMVCVQIGHSYVLIDSMNGQLIGPFTEGSFYDATPLLALHAGLYEEGDPVEYIDEEGRTVRGPVPIGGSYPTSPMAVSVSCWGCIACMTAVTASCSILCYDQPWWDTPGEGWGMCMGKCYLAALGMPLELIDVIRGNQQINPGTLTMTVCESMCGGCGRQVWSWLKKKIVGPTRGYLKPPPGWRPRSSVCN
jgi:hypothetical protein